MPKFRERLANFHEFQRALRRKMAYIRPAFIFSILTTSLPLLLKFAVCSDPRSVANGYGDCKAILASRKLPRLLLPSTVGRMVVAPSGTIAPVVWAVARVTEVGEHFFVGNLSILTNSGHTLLTIEGLPT